MTGRAVLFHAPGQPLEHVHLPLPVPQGSEVLVRVARCALCRSDLHSHAGRRPQPGPCVLGHEVVGHVQALGPDAPRLDLRGASLAVGDRVTWTIAASCGTCFLCADGMPQKCETLYKYGHEAGRAFTGGLADHVLLMPGTGLVKLPDALPDSLSALINCAFATAAAALRAGGNVEGRSVVILGAGILGLAACAMARRLGAREVAALDVDEQRQARAAAFGATGPVARPDLVLELAGTADAVRRALVLPRVGGTIILAGTVQPTTQVTLDPEQVVRRLLTIRGVHNYAPQDLVAAVGMIESIHDRHPFDSLMGPAFPLERAEEAFAHAHADPGHRVSILPWEEA